MVKRFTPHFLGAAPTRSDNDNDDNDDSEREMVSPPRLEREMSANFRLLSNWSTKDLNAAPTNVFKTYKSLQIDLMKRRYIYMHIH